MTESVTAIIIHSKETEDPTCADWTGLHSEDADQLSDSIGITPITPPNANSASPAIENIQVTSPSLSYRLWEIISAYVPLTYTSFGGPQVHIAMFIHEFVEHRKWLPSHVFAELFAIAQALPGPASTQLGYSIGLARAGVLGGLLSFVIWRFFDTINSIFIK
ncbi:hypothetical protein BDV3_001277 [Batrachochytrium dendrobatidis]